MNVEQSLVRLDCNNLVSKNVPMVKQKMYFGYLDFMFMIVLLQLRILHVQQLVCYVLLNCLCTTVYGKACFAYNLKPYISAVRLCSAIVFQNTAVKP